MNQFNIIKIYTVFTQQQDTNSICIYTEKPGRLQSMDRKELDVTDRPIFTFTCLSFDLILSSRLPLTWGSVVSFWRRKWQPTPVFLPGESCGQRSLVGCRLWDRTESDTTEVTQQQQQPLFRVVPETYCFTLSLWNSLLYYSCLSSHLILNKGFLQTHRRQLP